MKKEDAIKKLEEAGLDKAVIDALTADDGSAATIAALEAKLKAEEGKSGGILADKKKAQKQLDDMQAKLDELEHKDLGELERMKIELEREKSKFEKAESERKELEANFAKEKRDSELTRISASMKWLDAVPDDTRQMILANEMQDIEDLGNTVMVEERIKSLSTKYAGMLAAEDVSGAGSKAGPASRGGDSPSIEKLLATSEADIAADPVKYLKAAEAVKN